MVSAATAARLTDFQVGVSGDDNMLDWGGVENCA